LITSQRTAVGDVVSKYTLYRECVKANLLSARGPIDISSDLWISLYRYILPVVCAQRVDSDTPSLDCSLTLRECRYLHSEEKWAQLIHWALRTFDNQSQTDYHGRANASSNNICLERLKFNLNISSNSGLIEVGAKRHRIRCIAHTINVSRPVHQLASLEDALITGLAAATEVPAEEIVRFFN
ncbi:hypothetical protein GQ43DRAFT_356264, partial [Delitschia confertaspora ATCC 74209]